MVIFTVSVCFFFVFCVGVAWWSVSRASSSSCRLAWFYFLLGLLFSLLISFFFFFWLILFEWTLWDDDWSWLKLMHMMMMLDMGGLQWNMFSKLDGRETRRERPISYTNVFLINTNLFELQKYSYLYICI